MVCLAHDRHASAAAATARCRRSFIAIASALRKGTEGPGLRGACGSGGVPAGQPLPRGARHRRAETRADTSHAQTHKRTNAQTHTDVRTHAYTHTYSHTHTSPQTPSRPHARTHLHKSTHVFMETDKAQRGTHTRAPTHTRTLRARRGHGGGGAHYVSKYAESAARSPSANAFIHLRAHPPQAASCGCGSGRVSARRRRPPCVWRSAPAPDAHAHNRN